MSQVSHSFTSCAMDAKNRILVVWGSSVPSVTITIYASTATWTTAMIWLISLNDSIQIQPTGNRYILVNLCARYRISLHYPYRYRCIDLPPRDKGKKIEIKGTFVGAKVIRGPNWDWGDQDGGLGISTTFSVALTQCAHRYLIISFQDTLVM